MNRKHMIHYHYNARLHRSIHCIACILPHPTATCCLLFAICSIFSMVLYHFLWKLLKSVFRPEISKVLSIRHNNRLAKKMANNYHPKRHIFDAIKFDQNIRKIYPTIGDETPRIFPRSRVTYNLYQILS